MKRYLKVIISCLLILFFALGCVVKVANSEWVQRHIIVALTQTISENTSLKTPVISYETITWGGLYHPLSLSVAKVQIKDASNQQVFAEKIYAGWSLISLISLKSIPSWFKVEQGRIEQGTTTLLSADFTFSSESGRKSINIIKFVGNIAEIFSYLFSVKSLQDIHVPIQIQGKCEWKGETIEQLNVKLSIAQGVFSYAPYFPKSLPIDKIELTLKLKDNQEIHSMLSGEIDKIPVHIVTAMRSETPFLLLNKQEGNLKLNVDAKAASIPIDRLTYLWPVGLAPKPRHWVTTNLSKGQAKEATLKADIMFLIGTDGKLEKITTNRIEGDIYPEGVSVNYLGKLPKVINTRGHAYYTKTQFIIDAKGDVNDMVLSQGHIVINDLHKKDQDIQIGLNIEGDVGKAFEIISATPLNLTQKLGLNFKEATGASVNHVDLKFPLESNVDLKDVDVHATSKILEGKATLLDVVEGEEIEVTKGDLDLEVTRDRLVLTGKADLNGMQSDISWIEHFDEKKSPFLRQLNLEGIKNLLWGEEESPFLKGKAPIALAYQKSLNHKTTVDIKIGLSPILINFPWASFYKPSGTPADFVLKMEGANKKATIIKQGKLSGKNFQATVAGTWGKPSSVITIRNLKVGDITGNLKLSQKNKRYRLQGIINEMDVFPLLNQSYAGNGEKPTEMNADVFLKVKKVIFSDHYNLPDVKFKLQLTDGDLQTVEIKDGNEAFNFTLTPAENHIQHFIISSKNAAELLELLSPGSDFSGGNVNIVGTRKKMGEESEIQGELDIRNLVVHEAPLLAKILSLTSFNGIMNALSGDGLLFTQGSAHIKWRKENIEVKDAFLRGASLGLTFEGTVQNGNLNFIGEVIPFYALNSGLSKIPLVGNILSGNSKHAIFSTYFELKGRRDKTDIQVSPLTTFAPGGMRKMFGTSSTPPSVK